MNSEYEKIFQRNIGVFTKKQQSDLSGVSIGIAGLGGVGGILFERLVRLGIQNFHVTDPDDFELSNLNRQMYSHTKNIGKNKAKIIVEEVKKINPSVKVRVFDEGINEDNVQEFVQVDIVVDAIEYNLPYFLYLLHREARKAGKHVLAAQAIGFGANLFTFSPNGVTFEDYIGLKDPENKTSEQINNYRIPIRKFCPKLPGYIPKALALKVFLRESYIPSCSLGVMAAASLIEMIIIKLAIGDTAIRITPEYYEIDFHENY